MLIGLDFMAVESLVGRVTDEGSYFTVMSKSIVTSGCDSATVWLLRIFELATHRRRLGWPKKSFWALTAMFARVQQKMCRVPRNYEKAAANDKNGKKRILDTFAFSKRCHWTVAGLFCAPLCILPKWPHGPHSTKHPGFTSYARCTIRATLKST